jgi:hypothetical protein
MSTALRLFLASFGVLNIIAGTWLGWASRQRLSTNILSRSRTAIARTGALSGLAMFFLGLAIVLLATIKVDAWSVLDWIGGVDAAMVLYFAGAAAGVLVGTELQKEAARDARPPIESNGAQA